MRKNEKYSTFDYRYERLFGLWSQKIWFYEDRLH